MAIQAQHILGTSGIVIAAAYYRINPFSIHTSAAGVVSGEYVVGVFADKASADGEPVWKKTFKIASVDLTKPIKDQLYADLNAKIAASQASDAEDAEIAAANADHATANADALNVPGEPSLEAAKASARARAGFRWKHPSALNADYIKIVGATKAV